MSFLALVIIVVLIGLIVGLAQQAPWIDATFKQIIWWVGIICVIVVICVAFGVMDLLQSVRIPSFHGGPH